MALTRADATDYLADEYGTGAEYALLTMAHRTSVDAVGGVKVVIDKAWLALGVPYSDLTIASVEDSQAEDAFALLRLFALDTILLGVNEEKDRGKIKVGGLELDAGPFVQKLKDLYAVAFAECKQRGLVPSGSTGAAFLGGIDTTDVAMREEDTTRVPSLFTRDTSAPLTINRWPGRWGEWR